MHVNPLSRRAALSGVLRAVPAIAGACLVAAPTMASPTSDPDAHLFPLLDRLKAACARNEPLLSACAETSDTFHDMILRHEEHDVISTWEIDSGRAALNEAITVNDEECVGIMHQMWAKPPKTVAGFGALAEALSLTDLQSYWQDEEHDRDWDRLMITRLIEVLMTGEAPTDGRTGLPA